MKADDAHQVRATISFPLEIHKTLKEIAGQRKASVAWVVRGAGGQHPAGKWRLLRKRA